MRFRTLCAAGAIGAALTLRAAHAAGDAGLSGDQLLQRATSSPGLRSYSVPVHFDVRMHRPISVRTAVQATAYYEAPGTAVLVLTNLPGVIKSFFKTSYHLDMAPQAWPAKYAVSSVREDRIAGTAVYVLAATPKAPDVVDRVTFQVTQTDAMPVSALWHYRDNSSIRLTLTNRRSGDYVLPQTESIAVSMPQYSLDAVGTYGDYALNAAVPASLLQAP